MVKAYVLIKTAGDKAEEVIREILEISVVEEAHLVFGAYDIVVEIRGRDMETIVEIITQKLRKIDGLVDTQSLLVVDVELDLMSTSLTG